MSRTCPDCREAMVEEFHSGVRIDACPYCAGVWFDQGELERLREESPVELGDIDRIHLREAIPKSEARWRRACPDCGDPLRSFRYEHTSPIELDSCKRCLGIWVEDGELIKIELWWNADATATQPADSEPGRRRAAISRLGRVLMQRPLWTEA